MNILQQKPINCPNRDDIAVMKQKCLNEVYSRIRSSRYNK